MFGSIGTMELVVILVIALIVFGPRKLPELGKSLGKSLGEFKRASNDLRNTLEDEIHVEEQTRREVTKPLDTESEQVPATASADPTPAAASADPTPAAASADPTPAPTEPLGDSQHKAADSV